MSEVRKERTTKKYTYRGLSLEDLAALKNEQLVELFRARIKRRFNRGLKHKYQRFVQKLRKNKKNLQPGEKPNPVKTHLRNAIVLPEMVGSVVGIHTGKEYANVEIKFDMIGRYMGEFGLTYKPTTHGKPGVGATKGSSATALK
jgi:small subunit ribosomal protein S15e